jgi:hypothetical protein
VPTPKCVVKSCSVTATLRFSFQNGVQHSTVGSHRHRKYRRVTHYAARAITCNTLEQYTQEGVLYILIYTTLLVTVNEHKRRPTGQGSEARMRPYATRAHSSRTSIHSPPHTTACAWKMRPCARTRAHALARAHTHTHTLSHTHTHRQRIPTDEHDL